MRMRQDGRREAAYHGYNPPSPEIQYKIELSRQRAEQTETRELNCPVCGFLVQIIPVTQTDLVFAKCRKCKFTGALDPAYFRRMKRLQAYHDHLAGCIRKKR